MVTSSSKIDKVYDGKVAKLNYERDKRYDRAEIKKNFTETSSKQNEMQKFLSDGLNIKEVSIELLYYIIT
jgi:hypothetical protein